MPGDTRTGNLLEFLNDEKTKRCWREIYEMGGRNTILAKENSIVLKALRIDAIQSGISDEAIHDYEIRARSCGNRGSGTGGRLKPGYHWDITQKELENLGASKQRMFSCLQLQEYSADILGFCKDCAMNPRQWRVPLKGLRHWAKTGFISYDLHFANQGEDQSHQFKMMNDECYRPTKFTRWVHAVSGVLLDINSKQWMTEWLPGFDAMCDSVFLEGQDQEELAVERFLKALQANTPDSESKDVLLFDSYHHIALYQDREEGNVWLRNTTMTRECDKLNINEYRLRAKMKEMDLFSEEKSVPTRYLGQGMRIWKLKYDPIWGGDYVPPHEVFFQDEDHPDDGTDSLEMFQTDAINDSEVMAIKRAIKKGWGDGHSVSEGVPLDFLLKHSGLKPSRAREVIDNLWSDGVLWPVTDGYWHLVEG